MYYPLAVVELRSMMNRNTTISLAERLKRLAALLAKKKKNAIAIASLYRMRLLPILLHPQKRLCERILSANGTPSPLSPKPKERKRVMALQAREDGSVALVLI